jgi:hypothetical protein
MALTIDATVGGATSNSYATVVEADAIAEETLPVPAAWNNAEPEERVLALVAAVRFLDQSAFAGARATGSQALAWPRTGVLKAPDYDDVTTYDSAEIPAAVKRAQARLAFYLLERKDADPFGPDPRAGLTSLSAGGDLSVSLDGTQNQTPPGWRYMAAAIRPILGHLVRWPQPRVVRG